MLYSGLSAKFHIVMLFDIIMWCQWESVFIPTFVHKTPLQDSESCNHVLESIITFHTFVVLLSLFEDF
jgi:hypothetical protein